MPLNFKTIRDCENLRWKRVFVAIDLNVPIQNGAVAGDYRIAQSKQTLDFLKENGAQTLLVSHRTNKGESLAPVYEYLKKFYSIAFAKTIEDAESALEKEENGSFVLLENIRRFEGEEENSEAFAKKLAGLADVYVNEAFSASHRVHASIVGVPKFLPHYAGFLFAEELQNLSRTFSPPAPSLVILGGAKFKTKMPLVKKFLDIASTVFVCGALANDFLKARGMEVSDSLISGGALPPGLVWHPNLAVPSDVVWRGKKIIDAGEKTVAAIRAAAAAARFILWNGPLGQYEEGYGATTEEVACALAESGAETIVGGGDTLAAIARLSILEKFSFVSTGGGAMLQFLANGTLPGIEALRTQE